MRRIAFAAGTVLLLTATSCPTPLRLRLAKDAAPGMPVFTATYGKVPLTKWERVKVAPCRPPYLEHAVWEIARDSSLAPGEAEPGPASIVYGKVPPGFVERVPAEPLKPGRCYTVAASSAFGYRARGWMEIELAEDGHTVGLPRRLFGGWERQLERGAVACVRGYQGARTPADSAAVDERSFAVSDTTVRCGYLRRHVPGELAGSVSTEQLLLAGAAFVAGLVGLIYLDERFLTPERRSNAGTKPTKLLSTCSGARRRNGSHRRPNFLTTGGAECGGSDSRSGRCCC